MRLLLWVCALTVLSLPSALWAQEKNHDKHKLMDKEGAHKPGVYDLTYEHDGHHVKKKFDLAKKEEAEEFFDQFMKGHAAEAEVVKDIENPMKIAYDLGIWAIVVFVLLLLVLRKLAWGPMLEGLRKREESIRSAVDEAKHAREETERLRAEFQAEMAKAYEKIPKMMEDARRDAQHVAEELRARAQADITAERQRLRREIDTARDHALHEIWNQAAQLATLISAKAIRRALSAEDHRRLVDEALTEMRQAPHK